MPGIVATNMISVVMEYLSGGEKCANVYHVHKSTPWTPINISDVLTTFTDWETATASPLRSNEVSLIRITGTDLTSLTSARVDVPLVAPIVGSNVAPVLPANATFAVKANIGERGKGRNGRTFFIGLAENKVAENSVDETFAGDVQTALNTLITDISGGTPAAVLGIIHTEVGGVPVSPAPFSAILEWSYTDLFVDSQKNRLPGHKRHKKPTP
jgi:hypothetical protein